MHPWTNYPAATLFLLFLVSLELFACDSERGDQERRVSSALAPESRLESPSPEIVIGAATSAVSTRSERAPKPSLSDPPDTPTEAFELLPPEPPTQWVACDERGFVHLTSEGFRAYRNVDFRLMADVHLPQLSNVVALAGGTYLLLGKRGVYRYYHGQKKPRAFARVPQIGPSQLWPDPQNVNQFWLRYARDDALHLYNLEEEAAIAERLLDEQLDLAPRHIEVNLGQPRPLPGLKGGPFTFLADGDAFYTVPSGLRRVSKTRSRDFALPLPGKIVQLHRDHRSDRYLVANDRGLLVQMEMSRGNPQRASVDLGGLPFGIVGREDVVAAIIVRQGQGRARSWQLKVFRQFKLQASWELRDDPGMQGDWVSRVSADRGICLFPHKPWLLMGGRDGVVVYDYRTSKSRFATLPE